jgi:hypothetical protein
MFYADMEKVIPRVLASREYLSLADIEATRSQDGVQRTIWDSPGWEKEVCCDETLNAQGTEGLVCGIAGDGFAAHQTKSNLSFHSTHLVALAFFK